MVGSEIQIRVEEETACIDVASGILLWRGAWRPQKVEVMLEQCSGLSGLSLSETEAQGLSFPDKSPGASAIAGPGTTRGDTAVVEGSALGSRGFLPSHPQGCLITASKLVLISILLSS